MLQPTDPKPNWSIPVLLVACTWVSVLSTDLYAPSLPHLPELLDTTEQAAKMTMSVNLAAFALAQLVHGALADRFGRRALLVAGVGSFSVASALCALAPSIEALILGRWVQGLLSSVPSVVVLVVIHELYGRGQSVRILGFHGMAVGVAPVLGPLIGGYIFIHFGWRANFWLLALIAATTAALVWRGVPETLRAPVPLDLRQTAKNYLAILSLRKALAHLLPMSVVFGGLFAFITAGPFLLIDRHGVSTEDYGLYFGIVILAAIAGGVIVNRAGGRIDTEKLEAAGFASAVCGVAIVAAALVLDMETAATITAGMTVFGLGVGLINASGPILLLDSVGDLPRSAASAIVGSAALVAASGASFLVSTMHHQTAWPMVNVMIGLIVLGCVGFVIRRRREPTLRPSP
ncbi:MAG: multidrug effflux MFS transporter [Hyphomicrobiales bacterium]